MGFVTEQGLDLLGMLVSEGDFPTLREIERLIKRGTKESINKAEYEKELASIWELMVLRKPDYDFWDAQLLAEIDDVAVEHFQGVQSIIGVREPAYVNALTKYMKEVIKAIEEFHEGHELVPKVIARFKFAMNYSASLPISLPIPTNFIFESIALSFKTTPYALKTVSY